jgi:SH3 domain protein
MKKLVLLILCILPLNLFAETLYVGDTLRVGIRPEPSKSVPSISVIKTGAAVEVLERKNSYAKVRTKSGVQGWVKSAYLTRKTPAYNKLKVANKTINTLEQQLQALQEKNDERTKKTQQKLQATIKQLQTDKAAMLNEINSLKKQSSTVRSSENTKTDITSIKLGEIDKDLFYIVIGTIFAILILGFLFGVSWYKQQVTKRLGGLSL